MSQDTKTYEANKSGSSKMAPFTIECGDAHGRYIAVHTFKTSYRGYFSLTNLHRRTGHDGKPMGGRPVGDAMSQMCDTPGLRMEVDPVAKVVTVFDPLENDQETLDHACRVMSKARGGVEVKLKAHPRKVHKVDDHTLKTLCVELVKIVGNNSAKVVSGRLPTEAEIAALPGRELHDPWNSEGKRFRFKDEYNAWLNSDQRFIEAG